MGQPVRSHYLVITPACCSGSTGARSPRIALLVPVPSILTLLLPLTPTLTRHEAPFSSHDKRTAVMMAQLISRAGQARRYPLPLPLTNSSPA